MSQPYRQFSLEEQRARVLNALAKAQALRARFSPLLLRWVGDALRSELANSKIDEEVLAFDTLEQASNSEQCVLRFEAAVERGAASEAEVRARMSRVPRSVERSAEWKAWEHSRISEDQVRMRRLMDSVVTAQAWYVVAPTYTPQGGIFEYRVSADFQFEGLPMNLDWNATLDSSGPFGQIVTLSCAVAEGAPSVRVATEGFFDGVTNWLLSRRDVQVGDETFDHTFRVEADEAVAQRLFDGSTRTRLLSLAGASEIEFAVTPGVAMLVFDPMTLEGVNTAANVLARIHGFDWRWELVRP